MRDFQKSRLYRWEDTVVLPYDSTPIDINTLERQIKGHPNPEFAKSVVQSFREGFWPWGTVEKDGYLLTYDGARPMPYKEEKVNFLRDQWDHGLLKHRFSDSFGPDLLPEMYATPIFPIPKEGSSKFCLISNQSAGNFPINPLCLRHDKGFPLINLVFLEGVLLKLHCTLPEGQHITLFKSDVAEAYRLIPMHPFWQIK